MNVLALRRNRPCTEPEFKFHLDAKIDDFWTVQRKVNYYTAHVPSTQFTEEVVGFINCVNSQDFVSVTLLNILTNYKLQPGTLDDNPDMAATTGQNFDRLLASSFQEGTGQMLWPQSGMHWNWGNI